MKILKQGDPERLRKVCRFRCWGCGCEWEADKGEYTVSFGQHDEDEYSMPCPCCGGVTRGRELPTVVYRQ